MYLIEVLVVLQKGEILSKWESKFSVHILIVKAAICRKSLIVPSFLWHVVCLL